MLNLPCWNLHFENTSNHKTYKVLAEFAQYTWMSLWMESKLKVYVILVSIVLKADTDSTLSKELW